MTIALDAEMIFDPDREGRDEDGSRLLLTGSREAIAGDIGELAETGVSYIQILFGGSTVSEVTDGMERFATEHMGRTRQAPGR